MSPLPLKLDWAVKNELNSDESLKWTGQPMPYKRMISTLGICWFGIPLVIVIGIQQNWEGSFNQILGTFFGIGMLLWPFRCFFKAKKTVYVITNKRAFTLELWSGKLGPGKNIDNYCVDSTGVIEKTVRSDGSGDLILAREYCSNCGGEGDEVTSKYGFFTIKNVNEVDLIIKKLFK